jgi:acetoin:2,6-dichlorophenolindophenol oxidoreductase subunit beta
MTSIRMTFAEALRAATIQAMEADDRVFLYGQGINDPGGFFGSTVGLRDQFSQARCFDVPLSEESLIGLGVGAALLDRRPMYVALRIDFLLLAMNQIVNHAAKWPAMSGYQSTVPLTIRSIIGKDWGQGAQHSGAYHAMFSQVPGLEVVMPADVNDAARLLLTALQSESPTIFIESKPLYDLAGTVELPVKALPFGQARIARDGKDITFVAISHMVEFAQTVAADLTARGVEAEVIDLRTLAPLDEATIVRSVAKTKRIAVFDVGWQRFGLAAEVARVLCMDGSVHLEKPLVSVGQKWEHTPAGCFLEYHHYPIHSQVISDLLGMF